MGRLQLTLACGAYDLTRGLIDGSALPQALDLVPLTLPSPASLKSTRSSSCTTVAVPAPVPPRPCPR